MIINFHFASFPCNIPLSISVQPQLNKRRRFSPAQKNIFLHHQYNDVPLLFHTARVHDRELVRASQGNSGLARNRLYKDTHLCAILLRSAASRLCLLPARHTNRGASRRHYGNAARLVPRARFPILLSLAANPRNIWPFDYLRVSQHVWPSVSANEKVNLSYIQGRMNFISTQFQLSL